MKVIWYINVHVLKLIVMNRTLVILRSVLRSGLLIITIVIKNHIFTNIMVKIVITNFQIVGRNYENRIKRKNGETFVNK